MKRRLNYLSILYLLVAMLFFEYGFWQLSYLTNIRLANMVIHAARFGSPEFSAEEITEYVVIVRSAYFAGFFTAGLLSFILSKRKRIDLYESLISFGLFWVLSWLGITEWKYFSKIARLPGSGFNNYWFFIVNGSTWLVFGVAMLLVRKRYDAQKVKGNQMQR